MKKIIYAGSELLTGDSIAVAVLEYSRSLAEADAAETIEIPIRASDGSDSTATILVGPASQIVAVDYHDHDDRPELDAPEVVERLQHKARQLRPVAGTDDDPRGDSEWADEY